VVAVLHFRGRYAMKRNEAVATATRRPPPVRTEEEITVERRAKIPTAAVSTSSRLTTKMVAVDARLLAIARGEAEADTMPPPRPFAREARPAAQDVAQIAPDAEAVDPFGGLIPVEDDAGASSEDVEQIDEDWLVPSSNPMHLGLVPHLRMRTDEILGLPIDGRQGFLLSQVDGRRTIAAVLDVCRLDEAVGLTIIDELVSLGAITLA